MTGTEWIVGGWLVGDRVKIVSHKIHLYGNLGNADVLRVEGLWGTTGLFEIGDTKCEVGGQDAKAAIYRLTVESTGDTIRAPGEWLYAVEVAPKEAAPETVPAWKAALLEYAGAMASLSYVEGLEARIEVLERAAAARAVIEDVVNLGTGGNEDSAKFWVPCDTCTARVPDWKTRLDQRHLCRGCIRNRIVMGRMELGGTANKYIDAIKRFCDAAFELGMSNAKTTMLLIEMRELVYPTKKKAP